MSVLQQWKRNVSITTMKHEVSVTQQLNNNYNNETLQLQ